MRGAELAPDDARCLKLENIVTVAGRRRSLRCPATAMHWDVKPRWQAGLGGSWCSSCAFVPRSIFQRVRVSVDDEWHAMVGHALFKACRNVLDDVNVANDVDGLFKLRHICALCQLRKGKPEEDVAKMLGFLDANNIAGYRPIVIFYQDIVLCGITLAAATWDSHMLKASYNRTDKVTSLQRSRRRLTK